jgi:hypothetical protein
MNIERQVLKASYAIRNERPARVAQAWLNYQDWLELLDTVAAQRAMPLANRRHGATSIRLSGIKFMAVSTSKFMPRGIAVLADSLGQVLGVINLAKQDQGNNELPQIAGSSNGPTQAEQGTSRSDSTSVEGY